LLNLDQKTKLIFRRSIKSLINFILYCGIRRAKYYERGFSRIYKVYSMWASITLLWL